ncbi:DEAD/DEAH box helicase family protein [Saccharibacillus endophyticus]|uniref:DEAD/DEAH box helicase family protein n=1 Tax=Saccharibacillus endophyticus TaxID=2060666 RepID=UPI00314500A4
MRICLDLYSGYEKHREAFSTDNFDLIVIDEFHHAAARSYRSVLDYFRPQTRTTAFCSSIQQADYLNDYFRIRGSRTLSLHSCIKKMSREEDIRRLDARDL